jgi:hypothetical protein
MLQNRSWQAIDEVTGRLTLLIPKTFGNTTVREECESGINNMTMFSLSTALLLMSVRT